MHPKVNATIDTEAGEISYPAAENVAIAVDTEKGLLVPVIKDAGDLSIAGLAKKIADLAGRTRSNKLSPDDLAGGTFTVTNTGSRGALFDTPIINQPQVAILGTGALVKRPVVVTDKVLGRGHRRTGHDVSRALLRPPSGGRGRCRPVPDDDEDPARRRRFRRLDGCWPAPRVFSAPRCGPGWPVRGTRSDDWSGGNRPPRPSPGGTPTPARSTRRPWTISTRWSTSAACAVFGGRWTGARREAILSSRVNTTGTLARALAERGASAPVFIQASGIGRYGAASGSEPSTEDSPAGLDYLAQVVVAWEAAAQPAVDAGVRTVFLRTSPVLDRSGGPFLPMRLAWSLGLGATLGDGRQRMPLISLDDYLGVVQWSARHRVGVRGVQPDHSRAHHQRASSPMPWPPSSADPGSSGPRRPCSEACWASSPVSFWATCGSCPSACSATATASTTPTSTAPSPRPYAGARPARPRASRT